MTATWQQEVLWLTVLYRMLECGDSVPVDVAGSPYAHLCEALGDMHRRGLIEARESGFWHATEPAVALRRQLLAMHDQALQFEIFRSVNLTVELDEETSDDDERVFDDTFDPRFREPLDAAEAERFGAEDLRLAMITYASKTIAESEEGREQGLSEVDPHRVVFLQRLGDGSLRDENVCFDLGLGALFREMEEAVEAAYKYSDVSDDPGEDEVILQSIYTAGMLERRKREGRRCGACGVPLALFEQRAREEGGALTACPKEGCGAALKSPEEGGVRCPRCDEATARGRAVCPSCGARLRWPVAGAQRREEDAPDDEEHVWGHEYGYVPHGWYDAHDLVQDLAALRVLCSPLF